VHTFVLEKRHCFRAVCNGVQSEVRIGIAKRRHARVQRNKTDNFGVGLNSHQSTMRE
jgi:hypothetical protein